MQKKLERLFQEKKLGELERFLREEPDLLAGVGGLLGSGDNDAVSSLLHVLGRVGFDYPDKVRPVADIVLELMGNTDPFVRSDAAQVFATLFAQDRACAVKGLLRLRRLLTDGNPLVRGDAAQAIGNIGFYFPELIDDDEANRLLVIMDTGEDDDEREAVAHALGKIGATNPELLHEIFPRLVRSLEKTREASCGGILLAFGTVGLHYPEMVEKYVPKLIEYLQSSNEDTIRYAVLAIGNIASNRPELVKDAIPHLERLIDTSDHDLRVNARMALAIVKK